MNFKVFRMKALAILIMTFFWMTGDAQQIPSLKVEELVRQYSNAKGVTVVNFWSSWCKSCQEEMPHFLQVTDSLKSKGVSLLLVSMDSKGVFGSGQLKTFIAKKKWKAPLVWLNETDADHYCPVVDNSWSGVIPVTLILNSSKNYKKFYENELTKTELIQAIQAAF
ncbi:MAG: TlpA disulfide reductase family protein [Chitinophagaceae bacterium]